MLESLPALAPKTSLARSPAARFLVLIPFAASALFSGCGASDAENGSASDEVARNTEPAATPGVAMDDSKDTPQPPVSEDALPPNTGAEPPLEEPIEEPIEGLPLDPNGSAAGGTSLNLNELLMQPHCNSGWLPTAAQDPAAPKTCAATFGGACFANDADACQCAGCGDDSCLVAESFPTQVSCPSIALGCNFKWFDACFETEAEACQAAGCAPGTCLIAESFPAQVSCQ